MSGNLTDALSCATTYGPVLPLCHPTTDGRCACPRQHHDPKNVGKAPLTDNGVLDATTDPAQIERWWTQWPDANVGLSLVRARLVMLDPDDDAAWDDARR